MLLTQVQPSQLDQIGKAVGVNQDQVANVLKGALPGMLAGLSKNASTPQGAEALSGALDRDHDGGVLDNLAGFLDGSGGMADGAKILGHIFGGKRGGVEQSVSQASGVDAASVAKIMAMVAPLIMAVCSRVVRRKSRQSITRAGSSPPFFTALMWRSGSLGYSQANTRFQSFFMEATIQPRSAASSRPRTRRPMAESRS